jgi:hypothetical protein
MIPRTKFGNCSNCDASNTECVKVGKSLYCLKCRNYDKAKQQTERANKRLLDRVKDKDNDRSYIIQDLDDAMSQYIRIKNADANGIVQCYTCSWKGRWQDADCGHFVSRGTMLLRWDTRNLKVQCKNCNQMNYGNIECYAANLNKDTPGLSDQLFEEAKEPHKWTRDDLKEMLIDIRAKLKLVKTKINV